MSEPLDVAETLGPVEATRLAGLFSLDLVGGGGDERFDRITRLAARALDVPIALVTLLDDDQQFMCSAFGTEPAVADRRDSFCTHAISDHAEVMVVEDAHADARFENSPFVTEDPFVRFYAGAAVSTPSGDRLGTLCVLDTKPRTFDEKDRVTLRDLADLVNQELRNTALALTDELTSLANRRAFDAAAERFIDLGRRRGDAVAVIYADVDGLKQVNDTEGHQAGDVLLRRTAAALSASARTSDVVARLGGDEFAVLTYGSDATGAQHLVEKFERFIAQDNDALQREPDLSISFGVAVAVAGDDVASLVNRADEAMYEEKLALDD